MLKRLRIVFATLFFVGITLMFLDFTGTIHLYLSWMAKLQFWPALMGMSIIPVVIVLLLTLLLGRIYCSVICPMGVFQDVITRISLKFRKRNPFSFSKEKRWLRYGFLAVMIGLVPLGLSSLLAPYSAFGRIANTLLRPVWIWGNNLLAGIAEHYDSYLFYKADVLITGSTTLIVAIATLVVIVILASRNGRTYCNTVCPVGTILGLFSRFSVMKVHINTDKCKNCGKCAKNCKAACIDVKNHKIDYSRCVVCGDCLENCEFLAIEYGVKTKSGFTGVFRGLGPMKRREEKIVRDFEKKQAAEKASANNTEATDSQSGIDRRGALLTIAMTATAAAMAQKNKKVDGGLAVIEDKQEPARKTRILPPGAVPQHQFERKCTACQLCVSSCPNKVLRPSTDLDHFMQPHMSFEEGYCRPECNVCSSVCPAGAIEEITPEVKASTKVGTAVFIKKNCIALEGEWECGNCARHCPAGAIEMVPSDPDDETSPLMPAVNESRCIGCGACENLCPARPFSAIYVEGVEAHREI